jgi:threonine/homoserine/homoserine lactone efflux protein
VPELSSLISFLLIALVVIVIPGPSVVFVIGRAMILGTKGAIQSVWGNALGVGVQILAVALGLGSLISSSEFLFDVIKILGALFLVYLGVQGIRHRGEFLAGLEEGKRAGTTRMLLDSVVVGLTNAKTLVFFIATFPLFVSPEQGSPITQMLVLGGFFSVIGVTSDMVWAIAAGSARQWLSKSSSRLEWVRLGGGVALIGLGAYLGYYSLTSV